ncbi:unnamed protein product [Rhizoctonia solani]|uniref:Uncharacterized protein n=1 Tax=Rhizoctonia solani TaxID=456999 RepID=A0A8H2W8X4_9AGAM|nr:unnamed protein product [Rhizoctonia solani]
MPPTHRPGLSHHLLYVPNLSARRFAHPSGGRLRIRSDQPDFIAWRALWGPTVFFKRLEYRKLRVGVHHEFILLRGLSKRNSPNTSHISPGVPSDTSWTTTVPDEIYEFVLMFEREASPNYQLNALVRTEAYDYVGFQEFADLSSDERNSTIELTIEFPEPVALEQVIKICSSISEHQQAYLYTLRQFNCFFYCWNIVAILLRLHVNWVPALQSNTDPTFELLATRLGELSDPQRTRPQRRHSTSSSASEIRPNLALLIAGEYDHDRSKDNSERPFVRLCHEKIRGFSTFKNILDSLQHSDRQGPLWIRHDIKKVRDGVREFLNTLADWTIGLAIEGTGESTINALFWGDKHIQGLSPEWKGLIQKEVSDLLEIYLNSMWEAFNEALKETENENRERQHKNSITRKRRSNALQRIGNSPLVLGTRLTPVGLRAAWNAARLGASLNPVNSRLMPFIMLMKTLRDVPNQIQNVSGIAGNFVSVLAMRRDEALDEIYRNKAESQARPQPQAQAQAPTSSAFGSNTSLNLGRSNVLGMMTNIDLRRPELEDRVVCELEKAIKRLALRRPQCTMRELRLATLEMLISLKEKGKSINFGLPFESIWRICLWYSLGEEMVKVLEEAAEPGPQKRIQCWLRVSSRLFHFTFAPKLTSLQTSKSETRGQERPMLVSEIHTFIHGRIKNLSEMVHNQGGPGATRACRENIEEAMNTIWAGIIEQDRRAERSDDPQDRVSVRIKPNHAVIDHAAIFGSSTDAFQLDLDDSLKRSSLLSPAL